MGTQVGPNVRVYIGLRPSTVVPLEKADHKNDGIDKKKGKSACSSNELYLILPTSVQMQGSGTNILFHHGCIENGTIVDTLGETAWNELWRSGTFWFLHCVAPDVTAEGNCSLLSSLCFAKTSILQYMIERVLQVISSPLTISVIQWMEGGGISLSESTTGTPSWRRSKQNSGEFTNSDMVMEFLRETLQETKGGGGGDAQTFCFVLVSITFTDPTYERVCEIVVGSVGGRFDILSTSTSISLLAVRSLFANIAYLPMRYVEENQKEDRVVFHLKSWAADVLPPEIVNFLFIRLFQRMSKNRKDEEIMVHCTYPTLPQLIYTFLDMNESGLSVRGDILHSDVSTSASFVRYLSFWSSLGVLVVNDDGENDTNNDMMGKRFENFFFKCATNDFLEDAKQKFLILFTDPMMLSRLSEICSNMEENNHNAITSRCLLAALEHTHRVTQWTRQKGLQRRIRLSLSSTVHNNNLPVVKVLEFFTAENEAHLWCQRLEWQYYTMLGQLFCAHQQDLLSNVVLYEERQETKQSVKHTEYLETTLNGGEKRSVATTTCPLFTPIVYRGPSQLAVRTHSHKLVLQSLLVPSLTLVDRLCEAEAVRRLLIKHRAAQSLQRILFSLVHEMQCSDMKPTFSYHTPTRAHQAAYVLRHDESPAFDQYSCTPQQNLQDIIKMVEQMYLLLPIESMQKKLGYFTEGVSYLLGQNVRAAPFVRLSVTDAAVQAMMTAYETATEVVNDNARDTEPCGSLTDHTPRQNALEERGRSVLREPFEGYSETQKIQTSHMEVPLPVTAESETERKIEKDGNTVGNEALITEVYNDGLRLSRAHRLCRLSECTSTHYPRYRRLLSTGRRGHAAKHLKNADKKPPSALSFSDIMKERESWCGPEDLDDYRRLMAYNVYVVGESRCGKSTVVNCLRSKTSLLTSSFKEESHTMTINRTSTIVEAFLPNTPLPLGGFTNPTASSLRQWVHSSAETHATTCRVGLNFIEMANPLLLSARMGHVKLPIRGTVYYIVYRLQEDWDVIQQTIWQYIVALQSAVMVPDPHVVQVMVDNNSDMGTSSLEPILLPLILIGTHADLMSDWLSTDQQFAARERLRLLNLWVEGQIRRQLKETASVNLPQPLLVDSCFTSAPDNLVISEKPGNTLTFQAFLHRTLQYLHHMAPVSPPHVVSRWLPQRFITPLRRHDHIAGEGEFVDPTLSYVHCTTNDTLEGFWRILQSHGGPCTDMKDISREEKQRQEEQLGQSSHFAVIPPQTVRLWWKCSSEGLLVLFTALQRISQFVSCCFDEQSIENAVLYHLGFVHPDDPDEVGVSFEKEQYLRERDVFLNALFEECRLRGVLMFLPCPASSLERRGEECRNDVQSATSPVSSLEIPCRPLHMVLIGLEWIENIWALALSPQMVVYHTMSLLSASGNTLSSCLETILSQCEKQLGIVFSASWFTEAWSHFYQSTYEISVEAETDNIVEMRRHLQQYFTNGIVSLELLRLLWHSPYNALTTNEMNLMMGLLICGLASRKEEHEETAEQGEAGGLTQLCVPCAVLSTENFLPRDGTMTYSNGLSEYISALVLEIVKVMEERAYKRYMLPFLTIRERAHLWALRCQALFGDAPNDQKVDEANKKEKSGESKQEQMKWIPIEGLEPPQRPSHWYQFNARLYYWAWVALRGTMSPLVAAETLCTEFFYLLKMHYLPAMLPVMEAAISTARAKALAVSTVKKGSLLPSRPVAFTEGFYVCGNYGDPAVIAFLWLCRAYSIQCEVNFKSPTSVPSRDNKNLFFVKSLTQNTVVTEPLAAFVLLVELYMPQNEHWLGLQPNDFSELSHTTRAVQRSEWTEYMQHILVHLRSPLLQFMKEISSQEKSRKTSIKSSMPLLELNSRQDVPCGLSDLTRRRQELSKAVMTSLSHYERFAQNYYKARPQIVVSVAELCVAAYSFVLCTTPLCSELFIPLRAVPSSLGQVGVHTVLQSADRVSLYSGGPPVEQSLELPPQNTTALLSGIPPPYQKIAAHILQGASSVQSSSPLTISVGEYVGDNKGKKRENAAFLSYKLLRFDSAWSGLTPGVNEAAMLVVNCWIGATFRPIRQGLADLLSYVWCTANEQCIGFPFLVLDGTQHSFVMTTTNLSSSLTHHTTSGNRGNVVEMAQAYWMRLRTMFGTSPSSEGMTYHFHVSRL